MDDKIFIFGHYGEKNTGDDAMIYALLQQLHNIHPTSNFSIISPRKLFIPPEVENKVKTVKPTPFKIFKEIKDSKTFVMGGGTQIYDYGNRFERCKVLLEMFILIVWAKIFCEDVYFLNIGVEPFTTYFRKFLCKKICQLADFITVRDNYSYNILKEIGIKKLKLSFDLAVLLQVKSSKMIETNKTIGLSILPFHEIYHNNKEMDQLLLDNVVEVINPWLDQDENNKIYLFTFKGKSRADDVQITEDLKNKLKKPEQVNIIPYNKNPLNTLDILNDCDFFIGMRYHSCLFAYLTKKPIMIINYFEKCKALAEEIGLKNNAVISIEEILKGNFGDYFFNMIQNKKEFEADLPVKMAKKRVKNFFSELGGN